MKQKAINSDFADKTITSNGGMAVKYGRYIYFINGLSAQDEDNTFGKVKKGAIARLELEEGKIKEGSTQIIVPKMVFSTNTKSGLFIQGDYIYYTTPSTEKNSKGLPKTDEMVLVRSRLDGSKTEIIKTFDDFSSTFMVMDGYIVYDITNKDGDKELRSIDLGAKKFPDKLIASKITSQLYVADPTGNNSLRNYVFYTKANENENEYSNVVYIANGAGSVNKAVIQQSSYDKSKLLDPDGYRLSLIDAQIAGKDIIKLIYNKADRGANATSTGTYSYDFKVDNGFSFDENKEIRYSSGTNYTRLTFLTDKYALGIKSDKVEFLTLKEGGITREQIMEFVPTFHTFSTKDNIVEAIYFKDAKFYKIQLFTIKDGIYKMELGTAELLYDQAVSTTTFAPEIIGDYLYFFNSVVLDNAYALDLSAVEVRNEKSRTPILIGIMTSEDEIASM